MEAECNAIADAYFAARPQLHLGDRIPFEAGFQRAWEKRDIEIDELVQVLEKLLQSLDNNKEVEDGGWWFSDREAARNLLAKIKG